MGGFDFLNSPRLKTLSPGPNWLPRKDQRGLTSVVRFPQAAPEPLPKREFWKGSGRGGTTPSAGGPRVTLGGSADPGGVVFGRARPVGGSPGRAHSEPLLWLIGPRIPEGLLTDTGSMSLGSS